MLKKRIIALVLVKDGIVVQSFQFERFRPIGKPHITVEFLNQWGIDEIVILDLSASAHGKLIDPAVVRQVSKFCHVPLSVGGGIRRIEDIDQLIHSGADKVSLNSILLKEFDLLEMAAKKYGDQCLVASVDSVKVEESYFVFDHLKMKPTDLPVTDFVKQASDHGAGEILIGSVNRDGSYRGFDLSLVNQVCKAVPVPVICSGGAGSSKDFIEVFDKTNVSAAAAGNFFHFTEHSVITTKALLKKHTRIRLETFATYEDSLFDDYGRLKKKDDSVLESMLYERIQKEVI
ncbi:imidazole glycerol phosphate synthase subunit HisF [Leptospira kanakyensis]|uniref:imidazole glycerol phosphate synthase subunit HisF n=1 Tax=Leptospira kanakyensis TaxID=2484968 RepID=UPI00223D27AB|nr:imidazole glycerol phosphate synthase cyclase subunit [Leptospira kanakyensis]MCW7471393.1 imidazole glycerol phosphate synthase cyclase subunit [Leptospira kanakyensis]